MEKKNFFFGGGLIQKKNGCPKKVLENTKMVSRASKKQSLLLLHFLKNPSKKLQEE